MKLFIFGSTGDLVKRKVMKALQDLGRDSLEVFAIGRRDMDRKEYQNFICSDWCDLKFRNSLHYLQVNFDELNIDKHLSDSEINYFYISLPPSEYKRIFKFLEKIVSKSYEVRILVEKPFGENLENALDLEEFLRNSNIKDDLFISDHYLFKKNFMNLPKDFKEVKIVSLEEVGLENRFSYYDNTGALKDMVQSHFLNLIVKILGFEFNAKDIQIEDFLKGQYKGYSEELGKESETETFVYVKFNCLGKKFEFITGKALGKKEGFVEIDGKRFDIGDDNSYVGIFREFFSGENSAFPTIEDSVFGWEITEKFEEFGKDKELIVYDQGSELEDVLVVPQKNS
jgi:glucose-6-phosphate 1-dehydrogenase